MASCTSKVDETAFSEKDNVAPVLHKVAVNLRFDVLDAFGVGFEPGNIDFNVEMTNIWRTLSAKGLDLSNVITHCIRWRRSSSAQNVHL